MAKTTYKFNKITPIKVYYDSIGSTLTVWFDDPRKEYSSEETGEEIILNKDKNGKVIGFEKLSYSPNKKIDSAEKLPVEVVVS